MAYEAAAQGAYWFTIDGPDSADDGALLQGVDLPEDPLQGPGVGGLK